MARARVRQRPVPTQLSVSQPPERLRGLLRVHKQLLDRIARRKKERTRLIDEARTLGAGLAAGLEPLAAACADLDKEIHALFGGLLARGRLAARKRKAVERQYLVLQNEGVISPGDDGGPAFAWAEDGADDGSDEGDGPGGASAGGPPPHAGGSTAARPGGKGPIESLRGLYRRLATAIHPDKVQDEAERTRRTEIMKEVTRAYGNGDLARLIEIERLWSASDEPVTTADDVAQRCATLERTNGELRVQLRELDAEVRELRRSPHGDLVRDRRRGGDPVAELLAQARAERDDLARIRDHVSAFDRGKITFADFIAGPLAHEHEEPEDLDDGLRVVAAALAELRKASARPRPSRSRTR
jgi:hypothetical protein